MSNNIKDKAVSLEILKEVKDKLEEKIDSFNNVYVTPEQFGAIGDGVTDDFSAVQSALISGYPVKFTQTYLITDIIRLSNSVEMFGNGKIVINGVKTLGFKFTECDGCTIKVNDITIEVTSDILPDNKQFMTFLVENCTCELFEMNNVTINLIGSISATVTHTRTIKNYKITNCNFRNLTDNNLGGIFWFNSIVDVNAIIENCRFEQNSADEIIGLYGGTADNKILGKINIQNCEFIKHNTTNQNRGFLFSMYSEYVEGYVKFENCSFLIEDRVSAFYCIEKNGHVIMDNCKIIGTPSDCLFFSRTYKSNNEADFILNNCTIETETNITGCNTESVINAKSNVKSPSNIRFNNCNIKCKMISNISSYEKDRYSVVVELLNSNVVADVLIESIRKDTGNISVKDCVLDVREMFKNNSTNFIGSKVYQHNKISTIGNNSQTNNIMNIDLVPVWTTNQYDSSKPNSVCFRFMNDIKKLSFFDGEQFIELN